LQAQPIPFLDNFASSKHSHSEISGEYHTGQWCTITGTDIVLQALTCNNMTDFFDTALSVFSGSDCSNLGHCIAGNQDFDYE
jgi:hypothetical protein